MFDFIVEFISTLLSDIVGPILVDVFMDRLYLNKSINILIRLFFTLPLTAIIVFLIFSDYNALFVEHRIFDVVMITILLLIFVWGNVALVKKILKNQKEHKEHTN